MSVNRECRAEKLVHYKSLVSGLGKPVYFNYELDTLAVYMASASMGINFDFSPNGLGLGGNTLANAIVLRDIRSLIVIPVNLERAGHYSINFLWRPWVQYPSFI